MPILNYNNRKIFKNKAAIELEFHKTTNYKLPPGYHSFDICLVGGGAGGYCALNLTYNGSSYKYSSNVGGRKSEMCPGGNGGYVLNLYNKKIDTNDIFVKIGNGGYCGQDYPVSFFSIGYIKKEKKYIYDSFIFHTVGSGESTYLKDNKTNTILYEAPGGGGFMCSNFTAIKGQVSPPPYDWIRRMGGGNIGGSIGSTKNHCGGTNGLPISVRYNNLYNEYTMNAGESAGQSPSNRHDKRTVRFLNALPNQSISLEGYGETKIFGGKGVAGGGCTSNFYSSDTDPELEYGPLLPGSYSTSYENPDGGGHSGIVYNDNGIIRAHRYSGNGKPNTGGGGAGGIYEVYDSSGSYRTGKFVARSISGPGSGGSGILVLRCYPDEKRPDVRFVDGINRYIIE